MWVTFTDHEDKDVGTWHEAFLCVVGTSWPVLQPFFLFYVKIKIPKMADSNNLVIGSVGTNRHSEQYDWA